MVRDRESTRRTGATRNRRADRTNHVTRTSVRRGARRRINRYESSVPPVMVRGYTIATGKPLRTSRKKNRRRYDVALGVPGAEIRLPSVPQVSLGWRLLSAVLVAALAYLLYFLWTSPKFQVQEPQVSGLKRQSFRQVSAVLDVTGKPIFTINADDLAEKLEEAYPEFAAVSVQIGFPDTVAISVTERVPVVAWRQEGRTFLVDAQGYAFAARSDSPTFSGPIVEATTLPPQLAPAPAQAEELTISDLQKKDAPQEEQPVRQLLEPEMVSAILALAQKAPKGTPLLYSAKHGLGWVDSRGWEVYFGEMQDIPEKLSIYTTLVKSLKKEDIQPVMVSVEYVHAPYYRTDR